MTDTTQLSREAILDAAAVAPSPDDDPTVGVTGKPVGGRTQAPQQPDPVLPSPRGPVSAFLIEHLQQPRHALQAPPEPEDDPLVGEDSQLALYLCYELHYRGFAEVDDDWEWEPTLLALRGRLEQAYETALRDAVGPIDIDPSPIHEQLDEMATEGDGPSLSTFLLDDGEEWMLREFLVHRTAYQLKEADPHTWAIPRLRGRPKAALVHIQSDEYGEGVEEDVHAELFALTLRELGMEDAYGAYLDRIPGPTLSAVNLVSMFGLHRRFRGALVGHLAIFEMFSVMPMGRYSSVLERMGASTWARLFFDTHVVADADHQTIAARELAGGLVEQDPRMVEDVLFGAHAIGHVEGLFTEHLLDRWRKGESSLLRPLAEHDPIDA